MSNRNQKITHWVRTKDFDGVSFSTPVVILGRWESKVEIFIGEAGLEEHSKGHVVLDTAVALGDYLLLGKSTAADPRTVGADQVRDYHQSTNLSETFTDRMAIV